MLHIIDSRDGMDNAYLVQILLNHFPYINIPYEKKEKTKAKNTTQIQMLPLRPRESSAPNCTADSGVSLDFYTANFGSRVELYQLNPSRINKKPLAPILQRHMHMLNLVHWSSAIYLNRNAHCT